MTNTPLTPSFDELIDAYVKVNNLGIESAEEIDTHVGDIITIAVADSLEVIAKTFDETSTQYLEKAVEDASIIVLAKSVAMREARDDLRKIRKTLLDNIKK